LKKPEVHAANPRLVYFLCLAALVILAFLSIGYYHPDEHFQILEFAAWKLNQTTAGKLPWEFAFHMRPAIQPSLVVNVYRVFEWAGCSNPFTIALFLRMLSASVSFLAMWMMYRKYAGEFRDVLLQKWFLLLSFLLWFSLYNSVRFSSETWSGSLFIIGFAYLSVLKKSPSNLDLFITGVLLGLSFIIRYQSGLLIAGFLFWQLLIKKAKRRDLLVILAGISAAFIAGVFADRWFYGEWTLTLWNYFEQNILEDKISGFGTQPWWFYFQDVFVMAVPPLSLVFIISFLIIIIFFPWDVLTWTILPFVLFHFIIGHKETRFLYPLIGFLPVLVIKAAEFAGDRWKPGFQYHVFTRIFARVFWYCNIFLIFILLFNPADKQVELYRTIYNDYPGPVKLYYFTEDPYYRAKEIHFYKRASLETIKADYPFIPENTGGNKILLALKSNDPFLSSFKGKKLIYSSYPEWIRKFNINHWVERTKIWYVFEISE
jgi:GPI mannosyltransferase 3